jgi:prefoldin subunit 5
MISRKERALYLATGGVAAAAFVWLRYAKSASSARRFLSESGSKVLRTLDSIQETLATISQRIEEVDRIGHELINASSEQKAKAEMVIDNTWGRLEQTTETIQTNLTESSNEIAELLKDIRSAVKQAISPKSTKAA